MVTVRTHGPGTRLEMRAGPSGYRRRQEDSGTGSPAVPAEEELRVRAGSGLGLGSGSGIPGNLGRREQKAE